MTPDTIKLTFIGDIMCQKEQNEAAWKRHGRFSYDETFTHVAHLFTDSDYVIGNLETPVASEALTYSHESFRFNTPAGFLSALKTVGINFLATANNHCLDRGLRGLQETLRNLQLHAFETTGCYLTKSESEEVFIKDFDGLKIAFIACTYGTNSEFYGEPLSSDEEWRVDLLRKPPRPQSGSQASQKRFRLRYRLLPHCLRVAISALRGKIHRNPPYTSDNVSPDEAGSELNQSYLNKIADKVCRARAAADFVVVMPHMGGQYNPAPGHYSKWMMRWLSERNVDCVVANHPHIPLRCERLGINRIGAYSLGNFTFNPSDGCLIPNQFAEYGIVLNLHVSRTSRKISKIDFHVVKTLVEPDGFAVLHPVDELIRTETNPAIRERLLIENEAVVNRFRGSSNSVEPAAGYGFIL
jgi:poly-gamma-glutamate synthesis protein (capsule biosynthesis protein)